MAPSAYGDILPVNYSARDEQAFHNKPLDERIDRARGLIRLGEKKESFKAMSELLLEQPDDPMLIKLAGDAMAKSYPGLAMHFYEGVLRRMDGVDEDALANLGYCIDDIHPHVSKGLYEGVLRTDPGCKVATSNLAAVCARLGEHEEALEWGRKALEMAPGDPQVLANTSMSLLAMGDWREGWRRYRYLFGEVPRIERFYKVNGEDIPRLSSPGGTENDRVQPFGVDLPRRLVVYGEQGIGDEVLFLGMLPQDPFAREAGYIETTRRLEGLFRRSFPKWTVYGTLLDKERDWAAKEGITHKLEMGALGEFFGSEPFRSKRYLETCPVRRRMWQTQFSSPIRADMKRFNIGLAWTGGKWDNGRAWRSVAPTVLRDLIDAHEDVNWVSLEYLPHDEVRGVASYPWASGSQDIDDVAALIDSLDLVISVTTSAVDISGALGKECWALVPKRVNWRYGTMAMGEKMHFYESVKCYRQEIDMDWTPTVRRISEDLKVWKGERKAA